MSKRKIAMLLGVLLISTSLTALRYRCFRQRDVIDSIRSRGGEVWIESADIRSGGVAARSFWDVVSEKFRAIQRDGKIVHLLLPKDASLSDARDLHWISGIESLSISSERFDDNCLSELPSLPSLHDFNFDGKASPVGLHVLARMPQIDSIRLKGVRFDREAALLLLSLKSLKSIHLQNSQLDESLARMFIQCQHLRHLGVRDMSLKDACISGLRIDDISLQSLDISYNPLGDRSLQDLYAIKSLKSLNVSGISQGKDALRALSRNDSLSSLQLDDFSGDTHALAEAVSKSRIEYLSLHRCCFSEDDLVVIFDASSIREISTDDSTVSVDLEQSIRDRLDDISCFSHLNIKVNRSTVRQFGQHDN